MDILQLHLNVTKEHYLHLCDLPWDTPLDEWKAKGVNLLYMKRGLSRHIVLFIERHGIRYVVKETSGELAALEFANYNKLKSLRIPCITPVGYIIRQEEDLLTETPIGIMREPQNVGYMITLLESRVIPDSILYLRNFNKVNRDKILNAIARLFAVLHYHGVYWGDASLANLLIRFEKEAVPGLGKRRALHAILADAETVHVQPSVTEDLRKEELDFFFESMEWYRHDLAEAGIEVDFFSGLDDKDYLLAKYKQYYEIEEAQAEFSNLTGIVVDRALGEFSAPHYGEILLQHIEEHKWYLNEKQTKEIDLKVAAASWYKQIFLPICQIFREENLLYLFPDRTAVDLYVEIMEHKYYLSLRRKRDVGFSVALHDFISHYAQDTSFAALVSSITDKIAEILNLGEG